MLVNALRAHLAEFGVIAPQGLRNVCQLIAMVATRTTHGCRIWRAKYCKYSLRKSSSLRARKAFTSIVRWRTAGKLWDFWSAAALRGWIGGLRVGALLGTELSALGHEVD